jgi:hypothetical protein
MSKAIEEIESVLNKLIVKWNKIKIIGMMAGSMMFS